MANNSLTKQEKIEKDKFSKFVGSVIRDAREKSGLTQEKLAEKANFHRTYIGFIEQGRYSPNLYTLAQISKALDLNLSSLLKKIDNFDLK